MKLWAVRMRSAILGNDGMTLICVEENLTLNYLTICLPVLFLLVSCSMTKEKLSPPVKLRQNIYQIYQYVCTLTRAFKTKQSDDSISQGKL